MTRLTGCPSMCAAAAAVLCSEAHARKDGLDTHVWITGQTLTTDGPEFFGYELRNVAGSACRAQPAHKIYERANIGA